MERFTNRASAPLAVGINAGDSLVVLASNTNFPAQPTFRIRIDSELMLVTAVSGLQLTVTRGIEGTLAATHTANAMVTVVLTAGSVAALQSEATAEVAAEAVTARAAESALTAAVAAEVVRATAAEGANTAAISAETARADAAEAVIIQSVTDEASRAAAAEGALVESIAAEAARATAAEGVLAQGIVDAQAAVTQLVTDEAARATAAEGALAQAISDIASPPTVNYYGSMILQFRSGAEVPFPEYKKADGSYVALPEPAWDTCQFELSVTGSGGAVAVRWCDARHVGTHVEPALGTGSLVNGQLDATLKYGAYFVTISGTISGNVFAGFVTTQARGVTEIHEIILNTETSSLAFTTGVYYSQFGNDAFSGASLKTPKKTPPTPDTFVDGSTVYLERGSVFKQGYIGNKTKTAGVIGVGAGPRPISDSFDRITTWADAGSGAWSATFVAPAQPLFVDEGLLGVTQVIEDGFPLIQKANLAAVQATPGTYAYSGIFAAGATVTLYIHPTSDPNTNGKIYEAATRQGFAVGRGASRFENLLARGSTMLTSALCHRWHTEATDAAFEMVNCISTHGIKHNAFMYGGHARDCGTILCQGETATTGNSHWVFLTNPAIPYSMTWHLENCFSIGNPDVAVVGDAAIYIETDAPASKAMNITFDRWYGAYTLAVVGSSARQEIVFNDSIIERTWGPPILGGAYHFTQSRFHQTGTWASNGAALNGNNTTKITLDQCLSAGYAPASSVTGTGFLNMFVHATLPSGVTLRDCTFVHESANSPWLTSINMSASANFTLQIDRCLMKGFDRACVVLQDTVNTPARTPGDYNTFSSAAATTWYRSGTTKTFSVWQSGDGIWAASDANSVTAVTPTFSDTTGRYPRYNQSSAHPGGCTATLVEPTELLGVQVLQALESTGRWPA